MYFFFAIFHSCCVYLNQSIRHSNVWFFSDNQPISWFWCVKFPLSVKVSYFWLQTIVRLAQGSQGYSPSTFALHMDLGRDVMNRYLGDCKKKYELVERVGIWFLRNAIAKCRYIVVLQSFSFLLFFAVWKHVWRISKVLWGQASGQHVQLPPVLGEGGAWHESTTSNGWFLIFSVLSSEITSPSYSSLIR